MKAVDASSDFRAAVERAALDLAGWPENFSDAHIHFDDRMFAGLVPEFSDSEWLRLGAVAADVAVPLPGSFLIQVPIAELEQEPEDFDLASVRSLEPWQPPSIHRLRSGSAFAIRASYQPNAWHRDIASTPAGAVGWLSGPYDVDDAVWRLSLMYETGSG